MGVKLSPPSTRASSPNTQCMHLDSLYSNQKFLLYTSLHAWNDTSACIDIGLSPCRKGWDTGQCVQCQKSRHFGVSFKAGPDIVGDLCIQCCMVTVLLREHSSLLTDKHNNCVAFLLILPKILLSEYNREPNMWRKLSHLAKFKFHDFSGGVLYKCHTSLHH